MADTTTAAPVEPPRVYLVHMIVFTLVVAILVAVILPNLVDFFLANRVLNAVIIGTLLLGMFHSYRMVARLFPEVRWLNRFRDSEAAAEATRPPRLLGPMANLLRFPTLRTPAIATLRLAAIVLVVNLLSGRRAV